MSIAITAFTRRGAELASQLSECLPDSAVWTLPKFYKEGFQLYTSLSQWTGRQFRSGNDLIFISAAGIAVRSIAPYVRDKLTDPAVLSMDENAAYVIPLLSGHVGGANALARQVGKLTGAVPVISTATDVNHRFAVDEWAKQNGMEITDRAAAKAISSALLDGKTVWFQSEFSHNELPDGVQEGIGYPCFRVTCQSEGREGVLALHPKILTVGIGCKKGLPIHQIEETVRAVLHENNLAPESVEQLASIDLKKEDAGIKFLSEKWKIPFRVFTSDELKGVTGEFTSSSFVQSVTGVDNVCERSAVLASDGGRLLVRKTARNGVTVAVACRDCSVRF